MTITLTREEAQQVLDALEAEHRWLESLNTGKTMRAIETLRARLSAPEPEPTGFIRTLVKVHVDGTETWRDEPFYIAPPQREWQGLTDKEILADEVLRYHFGLNGGAGPVSKKGKAVIEAVTSKLKEKNT